MSSGGKARREGVEWLCGSANRVPKDGVVGAWAYALGLLLHLNCLFELEDRARGDIIRATF